MKKIDWRSHFIELIVVFIGITAAFLLNSWREDRANRRLALKYYSSILKDLTADADLLDQMLPFAEAQDSALTNFTTKYQQHTLSEDEALNVFNVLLSINQFSAESGTYETIIYSSNLEVFSDYELREEINIYYDKVDQIMLIQDIHMNYIRDYCFPFTYKNLDMMGNRLRPGFKLDYEFTNLVLGNHVLLKQVISAYQELMEVNVKLKLQLAQKLSN